MWNLSVAMRSFHISILWQCVRVGMRWHVLARASFVLEHGPSKGAFEPSSYSCWADLFSYFATEPWTKCSREHAASPMAVGFPSIDKGCCGTSKQGSRTTQCDNWCWMVQQSVCKNSWQVPCPQVTNRALTESNE